MEFRLVGRSSAAHSLVSWLSSEAPDDHVRIVTGDAGCGKSWLMAWLAMAADADARAFVDPSVAPPVPPNAFDLVLETRGRTQREIQAEIEQALLPGSAPDGPFPAGMWLPTPSLYRAAKRRGTPFTVALLDTALAGRTSLSRVPDQLTEDVLLPLVQPGGVTRKRLDNGAEPVRILLDLPRAQAERLVRRAKLPAHALIDLDSAAFAPDRTAFRAWVRDLVSVAGSAYEGEDAAADAAADAVTASAWPNFLLAETLSMDLRAREEPWVPDASAPLPTSLEDAWRFYLSSFGEAADEVGLALTPVVLAEGDAGMPVSLAARAVSALSGRPTSEEALTRVVAATTAYIAEEFVTTGPEEFVTTGPDNAPAARPGTESPEPRTESPSGPGRVRHLRLRDTALAAAARRSYGAALPELQRKVATALAPRAVLTEAERAAAGAEPLSPEARYVLGPGLAHAAAGGVLDDVLADPALAFLVDLPSFDDADGHAGRSPRPDLRARRRALGQASRLYVGPRTGHVSEHASRLGLTASVCGDHELADWLLRAGVPRIWRTLWSHWRPLGAFEPAEFDGAWPGPVGLHGWRSVEGGQQFCTRSELSGRYQWWTLADGTPVGESSTEPPDVSEEPSKSGGAAAGPMEVVLDELDAWVGVRPAGEESPDATALVCPEGHVGEVHPLPSERALLLGRSGMMLIEVAQGRPGERALPPRPRALSSWWSVDDALYGGGELTPELLAPLFSVVGRPVRADPERLGPLASLPDTARLLTEVGLPAAEFWFEGLDRFVPTLPRTGGGDGDADGHAASDRVAASVLGYVGDDSTQLCVEHGTGRVMLANGGAFVCLVNSSLDAFLRCWTVALKAVVASNGRDEKEEREFRDHVLRRLGRIDPACTRRPVKGSLTTMWPQLVSDSTYLLE
ncbi:SUKH-4 family immunity protein [Streptomyces sp. NBC_01456]|uniref:SUKH-4 family immunity protein n=1 Tax=unclassified Streptomyces TaxID=2593676 RepID=UPI002E380C25|nr:MULTISPECIES: SUKH-4 family immunity protein [unclassified Streptomyces]